MYEQPVLNRVGKATEVILGIVGSGYDFDTLLLVQSFEFTEDPHRPASDRN